MFIDAGSPVSIVRGQHAGRFGLVSKIRVFTDEQRRIADVMIFCELFNPQSGVYDAVIVDAGDMARHKLTQSQIERLRREVLGVSA